MASGSRRSPGSRLDQPMDTTRSLRPSYDSERFGRMSERVARYIGSWAFIAWMTVVIVAWVSFNVFAPEGIKPDAYPFIFLTLLLSLQASYAAPLILLAQNRQADRDRLALDEDRRRAAMQKADTEYLAREIAALRIALGDVATRDFLRGELNRLQEQLSDAARAAADRSPSQHKQTARRAERRTREHVGEE